jgi:hypothetical protein
LKRATEALELLSTEIPQLSEVERIDLLRQGTFAIVSCLYGLGRWEEGVVRSKKMEPLLDQLERLPERAQWDRKERMLIRGDRGWANFVAGRPEKALASVLPILSSDRQPDWGELQVIMGAHDTAGNVYEKESSSDAVRRNRMIIAAVQALAFAGWSEEISASLAEWQQRLAQAEAYLAQDEEFS